jgi:tetratricopeptide (TPR) repeat protein
MRVSSLIAAVALGFLYSPLSSAEDDKKSEKREERRRLKLDDMQDEQISAQFRNAAHQKNLELIGMYEEHLKDPNIEGEQKAMLMFRLAEKYFEEGRFFYFQEMEQYEKDYDKCFATPGCDVNKMSPNNKKSQKWQKKSIRLYLTILDSYPQYTRADEVLFYLGSALQEVKQPAKAVKQFQRLTREYSNSVYLPDSYVNIGEYYFENNNAYPALKAYKQATKYKNSPKFGFALYKLAWCYYNVGSYGEAIENMKAVISHSQSGAASGDKKKITLQEEALKDLVRFFADAGEMDEAYAYFNKLGKQELIIKMLKRLAKMYFAQGKFDQAIKTYRRLIAENKNSSKAPDYQNEIISAYQKMGRKDSTLKEIQRLLKDYGKNSSWARANSSNPKAIKEASNHVERALRGVASEYFIEARKLGTGSQAFETYKHAEQAYRVYLSEFPSGKYSYDIRYQFGELLYTLAEYFNKKRSLDPDRSQTKNYFSEAFDQYSKVVQIDPKGKHSQLCAENAMFSAVEMVKQEDKEGLIKTGGKDLEVVELSSWEGKLLEAFDNYAKVFPKSKRTIEYLYESAKLLHSKNRLGEASERYQRVIKMQPKSKLARKSA